MVSTLTYATVAAAGAVALLSGNADAHQQVTIPKPTYTNNDKNVNWSPIAFLENQGVKTNADILGYLKSKKVKSLREFMDNKANYKVEASGATFDCGYTNPNGARQPIPSNGMMRSTGYTHEGPCEIWLDDVMVKHGDNCNKEIGAGATSYKIDWSSCKGNCMLRWYWFGNRPISKKRSWQVYKACIPLKGSSAREMNATGDGEVGADEDDEDDVTETPSTLPSETTDENRARDASKCKVKRE